MVSDFYIDKITYSSEPFDFPNSRIETPLLVLVRIRFAPEFYPKEGEYNPTFMAHLGDIVNWCDEAYGPDNWGFEKGNGTSIWIGLRNRTDAMLFKLRWNTHEVGI